MLENIIYAVVVTAGVGLICGALLSAAARFMAVKEDRRVGKLRECLPGANCGACGYTGCDSYAKALVEEGAKTNLCVPGAAFVAEKVAAILGVEAEAVCELTAFVHCGGTDDVARDKAVYDGVKSCRAASMLYGGQKACAYACPGFGDCAAVCPTRAIVVENGVARISPALCIGCGLCEKTCPKHIISLIPRASRVALVCSNRESGATVRKECAKGCIACRKCEKACPTNAIKVENNLSHIDREKCVHCGKCAAVCPVHCIADFGG